MSYFYSTDGDYDIKPPKERLIERIIHQCGIISAAQLKHILIPKFMEKENMLFYLQDLLRREDTIYMTNDNYFVAVGNRNPDRASCDCLWHVIANAYIPEPNEEADEIFEDKKYDLENGRSRADIETLSTAESPANYLYYGTDNIAYVLTAIDKYNLGAVAYLQERFYTRQIIRTSFHGNIEKEDALRNVFVVSDHKVAEQLVSDSTITMPFILCEIEKVPGEELPKLHYEFYLEDAGTNIN